ncbi:hypothetical protein CASFOL_031361 [Castilleja foliolosa]|uniref:Glabrous enhancer-binding protein-like DBD domain-containing protein n=1 Tax=Castilleja foliolosa TaxID=1961234 RepID=A0ABD3C5D3_9LAMI
MAAGAVNEDPISSEEEESEDDEVSESSEEESEKANINPPSKTGQDKDLKQSKSKIDSKSVNQETESDSESDLGSPSSYKLQPVSRVSKSTPKRTRDKKSESPVRSSKKPKSKEGKSVGSFTSTPSGCITRIWSDKDEIAVLNGMIEFKNHADIDAFQNFIKGKLQVNFSKRQLNDKIKRLKKRFLNALKHSDNGEDPVFSKPHEDMSFELSKKIWSGSVGVVVENGVKDEKVELEDEKESVKVEKCDEEEGYPFLNGSFENLSASMPSLEMSKSGMRFALSKLSSSKAKEFDAKWKVLFTEELELTLKKMALMKEQMNECGFSL